MFLSVLQPLVFCQLLYQSEQTAALSEGRYVYDIVIDDGFKKTRVIEGMVLVRRGVSV